MPTPFSFDCLVGQPPLSITPASPQWAMPLPVHRRTVQSPGAGAEPPVTYGDYFTAVIDYLSRQEMAVPLEAAGRVSGKAFFSDRLTAIRIHLIKHGAFYHPALVVVEAGSIRICLAVNVALSAQGRAQLPVEVESLRALERGFPENWVPRIYHSGTGSAAGHPPFSIFTGQWFSGFHEVHRTDSPARQQWSVWDADDGVWRLDEAQVDEYFRQAVRILTGYFDPHTFSVILDWHHAAGDFVLRKGSDGLEVRLITVRRYAPFFNPGAEAAIDLEMLLHALAVFWLRTSLWMRIDRLDGVGDLVWAGDQIMAPMWQGFLQGVLCLARHNLFPDSLVEGVCGYLAGYTAKDWLAMGADIIARCPAGLPESAVMQQRLERHAAHLAAVLKRNDKA